MNELKNLLDSIKGVGMVGERKALALLCLGFYAFFFLMLGLLLMNQDEPAFAALAPSMFGLGACYALAFYALAADWFWGRWFATGLGQWGLTTAAIVTVQTRMILTPLLVFAVMHGLLWLVLLGDKMAAAYDNREEWRKRFQLDEQGVTRVRNTVTRVSTGLPMLILWALAPKEGDQALWSMMALSAAIFGFAAVLQARTWGLLAVGVGGVMALGGVFLPGVSLGAAGLAVPGLGAPVFQMLSAVGGGLLVWSVVPYLRPITGYLRHRAR